MRQETNNEMDLLLRRLGRRQDTAAPADHLDADELSSYAENALPAAARARYTEHLAECKRCRDFVVQLSSSAGVVVAQETVKVAGPSALRKFLASLFSPMVLRYAVPALGLVVVAAIGFMVSQNEGSLNSPIATRREQPQPVQPSVPGSEAQPSSSPGAANQGFIDTTKSVNKPAVKNETGEEAGAADPAPPNAPPVVSITPEVRDAAKKVEQQQAEPKEAAPPPQPTPTAQELKKLDAEEQKQAAENRVVVTTDSAADKAKSQDSVAAASPRRARSREERGLAALQAAGAGAATKREDEAEKDKDDSETRTVAGRRFRRQGGVWVDTAYSAPRSTTDLARGSEGYRALVADEPGIKQIADALDGEIIVVWKGRPYRIK